MNNTIKYILLVAGVALLGYGIYQLVTPEASVDLGIVAVEVQDNNNAYISIGLGLAALLVAVVGGKKS